MIETFAVYRLVCDECGKKSDKGPLDSFRAKWHLDQFAYGRGYSFYRMSCSKECRQKARARFVEQYKTLVIAELALTNVKPVIQIGLNLEPLPYGFPVLEKGECSS